MHSEGYSLTDVRMDLNGADFSKNALFMSNLAICVPQHSIVGVICSPRAAPAS